MKEKIPKVEIINESVTTCKVTEYENGDTEDTTIVTTTNRVNIENLSEDLIRDYFGLKVTIDWENKGDKNVG